MLWITACPVAALVFSSGYCSKSQCLVKDLLVAMVDDAEVEEVLSGGVKVDHEEEDNDEVVGTGAAGS